MRRHVLFVLLALLVFAAPAAAAPVLGPQAFFAARQHGPLDEKAEPANAPADYKGPPIEVLSTYVGRSAIEPTIALDKMGNAFFPAAYFEDPAYGAGGHTYLMKSSDGGKSWKDIEPATSAGEDPPRDLDPWVYGDPDFGRIFDIGLIGAGSYLSYSDDGGETWRSSAVTDPGVNDHQSIVAAIAPDANPLLTPSDPAFPKLIYYCVNEVSRTGCTVSRDGGMTWVATGGSAYYGAGTNPGDSNIGPVCSALTGHLQADPEGRVLQPAGHCGQPYVSITADGGTTWNQILVNKDIRAADTHTELSSDADGNLYYVWIDPVHYLPWMATSTDHGAKWSDPVLLAPPGVWAVNFPTIVAGEAGRVAVTFSGTTDPDEESTVRPWNQYVLMSTNALAAQPLFISNIANQVGDPIYRGSCRGRCGGIFDFDDIQMSPVDGTFWATSSDSCTDSNDCNAAYEGDLPSSATPGDALGFSIHQTGGPKLTGPLPEVAPATPAGPAVLGGPAQLDTVKPRVRLTLTKRTFKVSRVRGRKPVKAATRFTLRMSEPAAVTIKIQRLRGKTAKQVGVLRTSTAAGVNRLPFTGRIGRATLGRGRYRAIATARDTAGNVGRSKRISFRVK